MKLPFKSNVPKDFDVAKHYNPILTEQQKEHLRKANEKQFADPEVRKHHSEISKQRRQDPEIAAKYKAAEQDPERNRKISESKTELYKDPDFKEFVRDAIKQAMERPEVKENIENGIKLREENGWDEKNAIAQRRPETRKKRSESLRNQTQEQKVRRAKAVQKPVMTPEGPFESLKAAGIHYNKIRNFNNGEKYVWSRLKSKEDGYDYISKEEYIMLTGKDI